jgi:hypothetical protein
MRDATESTYRTHYNYVRCIANQYNGLVLSTTLNPVAALPLLKVERFEKLAMLTSKGINSELDACKLDHDYAQVVAAWFPVKCYYRLYYLESVLVYLLNGNSTGFSHGGHTKVRKAISSLINNRELIFSNFELSIQSTISMIQSHIIPSGSNLSPMYYANPDCIRSVRKKVSEYVEYHWKTGKGIKKYSTNTNRLSRDNFRSTNTVNLTDYFYWMRIKVNYRDVDFLDFSKAITSDDAYNYIRQFAAAHESYAHAIEGLITDLKKSRGIATS